MRKAILSCILAIILISCNTKPTTNKGVEPTVANIDSLINVHPDSIPYLVFRGNLAIKDYRFSDALADGAKAFRLDSTRVDARMLYGQSMLNKEDRTLDDVANAQRHFQYIILKDPKNTDALVNLASTYRLLQDVDNAFKYVNDALRIDKKKREAYALKGSLYLDLKNYALAKSSYETAVQQDPDFYEAYLHLALIYHQEKNPLALEYYQTAYKIHPSDPELLYSWAFAQESFGKTAEALANYRKLSTIGDNFYESRGNFHLGHLKQRTTNEVDSALYFYSKAIDLDKEYVEAYHNRGMCYELKKDNQSAKQEYLEALKYNKEFQLSIDAYNRLAK